MIHVVSTVSLAHMLPLHFVLLLLPSPPLQSFFFFFNDTATTEIYTLSLHDALPICQHPTSLDRLYRMPHIMDIQSQRMTDRKSTRLNSSHLVISYAVFCLKKKKKNIPMPALRVNRHA